VWARTCRKWPAKLLDFNTALIFWFFCIKAKEQYRRRPGQSGRVVQLITRRIKKFTAVLNATAGHVRR
ncbi:MAG: hypothetical protein KDC70_16865, partial [Saprospiraceae bacterium]|nr:hypothetical protein [Saprospiraceae bacterium]